MWCWFSHRVDLQTAQKTLIDKDDDPSSWLVDVRTDVPGYGKDSTLEVWCRKGSLGSTSRSMVAHPQSHLPTTWT